MAIRENYKKKKTGGEKPIKPVERPNIYLILDFQKIIKEFLAYIKYIDPKNSYEFIAEKIGETKGSFSSMLNAGIKSLSNTHAFKLSKIFEFDEYEFRYFENSIVYTRAKDQEEKLIRFHTLRSSVPLSFRNVAHKEMEYFGHWFIPVIREVIEHPNFNGDLILWSKKFLPSITKPALEQGIKLLLELGYILEFEKGKYTQADHRIHSNNVIEPEAVKMYQNQLFQLGIEAQSMPKKERNLSSSSFKLTKEGKHVVDEHLKEFQRKLVQIVEEHSENANIIYALNWQLFPLSKKL